MISLDRRPLLPAAGRRTAVLAALALLVLAAHAWLIAGMPLGAGEGDAGGGRPLVVRQIVEQPATVAAVPAQPAAPATAPPRRPPHRTPHQPPAAAADPVAAPVAEPLAAPTDAPHEIAAAEPPAEPASEPPVQGVARIDEPLAEAPQAAASSAAEAVAEPAPVAVAAAPTPVNDGGGAAAPPSGGGEVPVYDTRMPPAALLQYELRRGVLSGSGELVWRPGTDGYEMSIEGSAFGIPILAWISRGRFDRDGLAPDRFLDRRRGRDLRAANFQRDRRVISYSGTPLEQPLVRGAQDRLSWMVQLAAIVESDPAPFVPGHKVSMLVAGARADADVWTFVAGERATLELPAGAAADVLPFRRAPRRLYDTEVEVWLDPARHHLPVRMRLTNQPSGESLEFLLRGAGQPAAGQGPRPTGP